MANVKWSVAIFILLVSICFAQNENLLQGDSHYALRVENAKNSKASYKNVTEAIKYYNLALKDSGAKEEAAWKLLRAYYFLGCFAMPNIKDQQNLFEKAKNEGKSFLSEFPKNSEIAYWYSVNLALWASMVNPITALNAGSVKETVEIANMLISQEETDKKAAARGYQILGRAHQKLPSIPFVLGWVNKDSSEVYLKKSLNLNSKDLATRLFLAEYYKEKGNGQEAKNILAQVLKTEPNPERFLEDERDLNKMRNLME